MGRGAVLTPAPDQLSMPKQPMPKVYGEVWKPIPGFPNYEASDQGQIRSIDRVIVICGIERNLKGRILKPYMTHQGFYQVVLSLKGATTTRHVHRLVLSTFKEQTSPDKTFACHRKGRHDNSIDNLYWGTKEQSQSEEAQVFAVI